MNHRLALLLLVCPALLLAIPVPDKPVLGPPDPERLHEALGEILDGTRPLESVCISVEHYHRHEFGGGFGFASRHGWPGSRLLIYGDGVALYAGYYGWGKGDPGLPSSVQQRLLQRGDLLRVVRLLYDGGIFRDQIGTPGVRPLSPQPFDQNAHPMTWNQVHPGNLVGVTIQGITVERTFSAGPETHPGADLRRTLHELAGPGPDAPSSKGQLELLPEVRTGALDPRALDFFAFWTDADGSTRIAGYSTARGYCVTCSRDGCRKALRLERRDAAELVRVLCPEPQHHYGFHAPDKAGVMVGVLPTARGCYPADLYLAGPEVDAKHSGDPEVFRRMLTRLKALAERTLKDGQ